MPVIEYEGHPGSAGGRIVVKGGGQRGVVLAVKEQNKRARLSRARVNLANLAHEGDPQGSPIMTIERRDTTVFEAKDGLKQLVDGEIIDGEIGKEAMRDTDDFEMEMEIA